MKFDTCLTPYLKLRVEGNSIANWKFTPYVTPYLTFSG